MGGIKIEQFEAAKVSDQVYGKLVTSSEDTTVSVTVETVAINAAARIVTVFSASEDMYVSFSSTVVSTAAKRMRVKEGTFRDFEVPQNTRGTAGTLAYRTVSTGA